MPKLLEKYLDDFATGYFGAFDLPPLLSVWGLLVIVVCLSASFVLEVRHRHRWSQSLLLLGWVGMGLMVLVPCLASFPQYGSEQSEPAVVTDWDQMMWTQYMMLILQELERFFAGLSLAILLTLPRCFLAVVLRQPKGQKLFGIALSLSLVAAFIAVEFLRFGIRAPMR